MQLRRRCKCGCGEMTSPGSKWIVGHNSRNKFGIESNHYKHGLRRHKLYGVWSMMRQRCYNSNYHQYQNYGGRGIRVFIRWRVSFKSFYNWAMAHGYKEGLQIDRQNNDGNYHPDNCRFATQKVNLNNKRPNKLSKNNTTGYSGVVFYKDRNKYKAQPWVNGKQKTIGLFNTAKEAAKAIENYKCQISSKS